MFCFRGDVGSKSSKFGCQRSQRLRGHPIFEKFEKLARSKMQKLSNTFCLKGQCHETPQFFSLTLCKDETGQNNEVNFSFLRRFAIVIET